MLTLLARARTHTYTLSFRLFHCQTQCRTRAENTMMIYYGTGIGSAQTVYLFFPLRVFLVIIASVSL